MDGDHVRFWANESLQEASLEQESQILLKFTNILHSKKERMACWEITE